MGFLSRRYRDSEEDSSPWWTVISKSDPRWNFSGAAFGMWDAMEHQKNAIEEASKTLGEPPADLEVGYSKP